MEVNIHEAKTHLSRLLQKVAAGEEVIISRAGVPVAKLVAAGPSTGERPLGMDRGQIWMAADFDAPLPEFEAPIYDSPIVPALPRRRNVTPSKSANQPKKKKR
jgi:prevent-host-death family protein